MRLTQALDHISEIHGHLARTEVYRGCGPAPVAATGVLAGLGALLQERILGPHPGPAIVLLWLAIAAASLALCGGAIGWSYLVREDQAARRRTRRVVAQLVPCLAAGAGVTAALVLRAERLDLLPGLWAVVFGLGVFAARPHLPRAIGWVALWYVSAGTAAACLVRSETGAAWAMGIAFGAGQLGAAAVLGRDLERSGDGG